jgi:hypothetical protein
LTGIDDLAGTSLALMTSRSRAENFGLQVVSVNCASGVLSTTYVSSGCTMSLSVTAYV